MAFKKNRRSPLAAIIVMAAGLALTGGGPFRETELISMHIFQDAFANGNFGTGQSKAVVMFIVVALAALVQVTVSKRYEVQR